MCTGVGHRHRARLRCRTGPGNGAGTRALFADCLAALAADPAVSAVALAVDLVEEYDGDDSFPRAALDTHAATDKPVAVLSNVASSLDQVWASRLRTAGVPVLEGTRSGVRALGHLLRRGDESAAAAPAVVDVDRRAHWDERLAAGPLSADGFALLRDYGIRTVQVEAVRRREDAVAAALRLGWPVVLKTGEQVAHKWDVGGVHLGVADVDAVGRAYDDLVGRLGPRVLVSSCVGPGPELSLGVSLDLLLGPLVVVAAGGVLVEVMRDRAVAVDVLVVPRKVLPQKMG